MATWKLLLGMYIDQDPAWEASEEEVEDAKMRGTKPRAPSREFRPGDTFESDLDLAGRFGPEKFLLLDGYPKDKKKVVSRPGEEMRFPPVKEQDPEGGTPGQLPNQQPYPRPIVPTKTADQLHPTERKALEAQDQQKEAGKRAAKHQKGEEGEDEAGVKGAKGAKEAKVATADQGDDGPDFDNMTLKELHSYAEEEEIDLKGARTKDEVLKAVKKK